MDTEQLIAKLQRFYSFELNQVDLYTAQSEAAADDYISLAFRRIAVIEQQHVDNTAGLIAEFGAKPTVLGDLVSPVIGSLAGKALSLAGTATVLRADIRLEEKAMQDYEALIHRARGRFAPHVIRTLQDNLIDEDLHTAWFTNKLKELEQS